MNEGNGSLIESTRYDLSNSTFVFLLFFCHSHHQPIFPLFDHFFYVSFVIKSQELDKTTIIIFVMFEIVKQKT